METLADAIEKKIPRLLEEAAELVEKAATLKDNAASEFESLSGFNKVSAIAKTVTASANASKLPGFIKN